MRLFPSEASSVAPEVDHLVLFLIGLSLIFIVLIFLPLVYFAFKYRRGTKADRTPPRLAQWKLEVTWSIIPLLLMMGVFAWGASLYFHIERPPADAFEINVVGKQWMWKVEHQEGVREINAIHVPVGRSVKLVMTSQDVIHSFFIPDFRIKQDVVPGKYTTEWFNAAKPGSYYLFCSQFCGTDHAKMIGRITVMEPPAYESWLASNSSGGTLAVAGAKLFTELGCSGCHGANSKVRAPKLEGIYGKPVPLEGSVFQIADDKYIRDCILQENHLHVAGFQPLMPTFKGHASEEELMELIAYIKSLGRTNPEEDVNLEGTK